MGQSSISQTSDSNSPLQTNSSVNPSNKLKVDDTQGKGCKKKKSRAKITEARLVGEPRRSDPSEARLWF